MTGGDTLVGGNDVHEQGGGPRGGLKRLAQEDVWDEIAYLAYHLHWDLDALLDLEHADRRRMVDAVADLNERAWEAVTEHA